MANTTEFINITKWNFNELMGNWKCNGANWLEWSIEFEKRIQGKIPLDLLTTGYFTGNPKKGWS